MAWSVPYTFVANAILTAAQLNTVQDNISFLGNTHDHTGDAGDGATLTPQVKQVVNGQTGVVLTGTTIMPKDDTIPQITEGTEFMSLVIGPQNVNNRLLISVVIALATSVAASWISTALFQDATAGALAAAIAYRATADRGVMVSFTHKMIAGTVAATTFRVRAGPSTAATVTLNGEVGVRVYGGVMASSITITEVAP